MQTGITDVEVQANVNRAAEILQIEGEDRLSEAYAFLTGKTNLTGLPETTVDELIAAADLAHDPDVGRVIENVWSRCSPQVRIPLAGALGRFGDEEQIAWGIRNGNTVTNGLVIHAALDARDLQAGPLNVVALARKIEGVPLLTQGQKTRLFDAISSSTFP